MFLIRLFISPILSETAEVTHSVDAHTQKILILAKMKYSIETDCRRTLNTIPRLFLYNMNIVCKSAHSQESVT
jgi:hypothetical protein